MKVAVVGMGAAGIHAARLLLSAGVSVECFEARDRAGGRTHSIADKDGSVFDEGGEWIDADHHRVLTLAEELGAELDDTARPIGRVYFRGEWRPEDQLWPEAIDDEERFEERARSLIGNMSVTADVLMGRTLQSLINESAESEFGRFWLTANCRSDEGDDPDQIGLLGWLDFYQKYLERIQPSMSAFRIRGGLGAMFARAAEDLPIRFKSPARGIGNRLKDAVVQFDKEVRKFDRVLLSCPISTLKRMQFEPPISDRDWSGIGMGRAVKVALRFDRAWWDELGWSGSLHSDTALQQVWAAPDGAPILNVYVCGDGAEKLMSTTDPVQALVDQLDEYFAIEKGFEKGSVVNWISQRNVIGGFPHLAPNYSLEDWRASYQPLGRIHFAGDWAADWMGFVEGALESAERAVKEILDARDLS